MDACMQIHREHKVHSVDLSNMLYAARFTVHCRIQCVLNIQHYILPFIYYFLLLFAFDM